MVYNVEKYDFLYRFAQQMSRGLIPNPELSFGSSDEEDNAAAPNPVARIPQPDKRAKLRAIKRFPIHDHKRLKPNIPIKQEPKETSKKWTPLNFSGRKTGVWFQDPPPAASVAEELKAEEETSTESGGSSSISFRSSLNNLRRLVNPKYDSIAQLFYVKAYEIVADFYRDNYQNAHLIDMLPKPEVTMLDSETYGMPGSDFLKSIRFAIDPDNGGKFEMTAPPPESFKNRGFRMGPDIQTQSIVVKARRELELLFSYTRKDDIIFSNEMEDIQSAYFYQLEYSGANTGLLQVARNARLRTLQYGIRENPFAEAHIVRGASCASIIANAENYLYERLSARLQQDGSLWIYRTPSTRLTYREFARTAPARKKEMALHASNSDVIRELGLPPELHAMFANSKAPGMCWLHPEGLSDDALIELIFQRFKKSLKTLDDVKKMNISFLQNILKTRLELFGPRMSLLFILQHLDYGANNFARALKHIEMRYPEIFLFTVEFESRREAADNKFLKVRLHVPRPDHVGLICDTFFPHPFGDKTSFGKELIRHYNEWIKISVFDEEEYDEHLRWMVASEMRAIADRLSVKQKYDDTEFVTVDAEGLQTIIETAADTESTRKKPAPELKKQRELESSFQNFDALKYWLYGYSAEKTIFFPGTNRTNNRPKFTCNVFTDWESQDEAFLKDFSEHDRSDKIIQFAKIVDYFSEEKEYEPFHYEEINEDFFQEQLWNHDVRDHLKANEIIDPATDEDEIKKWYCDELELTETQKLMLLQKVHARAADIGRLAVAHSVAECMWQFGQELRAFDISLEEDNIIETQEKLVTSPDLAPLFARLSATLYEKEKLNSVIGTTVFERGARMREINMRSEEYVSQIQSKLGDTPRFVLPSHYNFIK